MSPEMNHPAPQTIYDAVNQKFTAVFESHRESETLPPMTEYQGGQIMDLVQEDTALSMRLIRARLMEAGKPEADTWQAQLHVEERIGRGSDFSSWRPWNRNYIAMYSGKVYEVIKLNSEPHLRELGAGEITDLMDRIAKSVPSKTDPPRPSLRSVE